MSEVENELRSLVDTFVDDLSELVRRQAVEAVGALLEQRQGAPCRHGGAGARAARQGGRAAEPLRSSRRRAKRRPGEKRTPQELAALVERLFNHIESNPGQGVEQIGRALATTPTKDLTLPIRKLMNGKRVSSERPQARDPLFPPLRRRRAPPSAARLRLDPAHAAEARGAVEVAHAEDG